MIGRARASAAELSLAAALRDLDSPRPEVRGVAIRNLAPALLDELGLRPPSWWRSVDHPRRDEAIAALDRACVDPSPQNAALAPIGLAQLGAPLAWTRALEALEANREGDDDAAMFARECAVIAIAKLGAAAQAWLAEPRTTEPEPEPEPESESESESESATETAGEPEPEPDAKTDPAARAEAEALIAEIAAELRRRLEDPRDDVRFQAGPALIDIVGAAGEAELLAALAREQHPEIRTNLISALTGLEAPSPATCDALARVLASDEGQGEIGWEAALALTPARRPEAAPRLLAGLASRETRDQALEALALLGELAGPAAIPAIRRLIRGLLVPAFTQVRAAYALTRVAPSDPEGPARLDTLAKHPRPAVREAVGEARQLLEQLAARPDATDHDAYRRD